MFGGRGEFVGRRFSVIFRKFEGGGFWIFGENVIGLSFCRSARGWEVRVNS